VGEDGLIGTCHRVLLQFVNKKKIEDMSDANILATVI